MPSQLQIPYATAALVALLAAKLPTAYGQAVDVQESGDKDFDDSAQLILQDTAVRVAFGGASYGQVRDITRTTLNATLTYQIACKATSLRSGAEQRSFTQQLVAAAANQLAGARLRLPDNSLTEPILLRDVRATEDSFGPVENCFSLWIEVSGYAQFDGSNMNPPTLGGQP